MAEQAAFGTAKYMYRQGILTKEENLEILSVICCGDR